MSSPVAYASVAVYKDNSPLTGTITDHEGKFSLKVAQGTDSCQLVVEFIGYSKVSQELVYGLRAAPAGVMYLGIPV